MPLSLDTLVYLATRPWQLGDLATWISAAAGVATVILALAAALVGYRVYKVESGRDARAELDRRERAADERRSQATLVSTWYGRSASAVPSGISGWSFHSWGAWILNASDSPIYDVLVTFCLPTDDGLRSWASESIRVVPPYRGEQYVDVGGEARDQLTEDQWKNQVEVSLKFRDAAGRRWLRDRQGYLHERSGPPRVAE